MISRNDPCWCGSGIKWKKCHYPKKPDPKKSLEYLDKYGIIIKTERQIEKIRRASKIAAKILDELCREAKVGITTNQLNDLSLQLHKKYNATPAPLGYGEPPFPKTICTSLNEVICHGIPNDDPLKEGDIINIDVTSVVDGFYGDTSRMVMINEVSEEKKHLVEVTYRALMESIRICKPGTKIYQIGDVIEKIAEENHFSVVNQFVGHGVGVDFHEAPQIPHHKNRFDLPLVPGMTFTIEPMINIGKREAVIDPIDLWTARTKDHKPSAQWEHTILITQDGYEILTSLD